MTFNFKSTDNFSIEIFDKRKRYLLSPIENLKIFNKIKIKKIKNNYIYNPQSYLNINEYNQNEFKPGCQSQMNKFIQFTKGKKIINDINFSKKIVQLCEKILK